MGRLYVVSGSSGVGKGTLLKLFLSKHPDFKLSISCTTRNPRDGEENGKNYFFITKEEFERKVVHGDFVEYTLYNGNLDGSTKDQIAKNRCVVIDPAGLRAYIALNDDSIMTFFLDADEETRRERMMARGDDKEKIESRIIHDREAFKKENIPKVDYHIDSSKLHNVEEVTDEIYRIYTSKK